MSKAIHITGDALTVLQQLRDAIRLGEAIEKMRIGENIVLVFTDHEKDRTEILFSHNIVTDAGDLYYAQHGANQTPNPNFAVTGGMRLGTGAGTPDKSWTDCDTFFGVGKVISATYPKTNDGDPSNTGADVDIVSYRHEWSTTENNGSAMTNGAIVDDIVAPSTALCAFLFGPRTKANTETLSIFTNHRMNGV